MSKIKVNSISPKERYKIIGEFLEIVTQLKNRNEVSDFLIGLLTPSESLMLARRIQIAKLIIQGKSYESIRRELGVSYQTINSVEKWLSEEKYREILERRFKDKDSDRSYNKYSRRGLLDKYPQHRFLKDLLGL